MSQPMDGEKMAKVYVFEDKAKYKLWVGMVGIALSTWESEVGGSL